RAVARDAAGAREAHCGAAGEALELVGQERRVGRDGDQDRARIAAAHEVAGDALAEILSGDAQLAPPAAVALHHYTDRGAVREAAGRGADAALELVAHHARAAAHRAFLDRAGVRRVERRPGVFGLHVEAVDVVELAVPG